MKLKEIGKIITGNTPSKSNKEYYDKKDINFFKPSDFKEDIVNELKESEEFISEQAREKARMLPKGSVLVTCIGTIGKVGILSDESTCNQQINAIIPNELVTSEYLANLLLSKRHYLKKKANAPVVPIINKTDFSNIEIEIYDIETQKIIVNKLNEIRELITIKHRELEKLNTLVKSQFFKMFGDPISNSKKIDCMEMPSVCEIVDGDRGKNYPKSEDFFNNEYCLFLNAKNVTNAGFSFDNCMFITKEKDEKLRNGKLKRGDIVLTTRGTVGNLAFYSEDVPFDNVRINSGMVILRMKKDIVNEIFFIEQFKMQIDNIKNKIANGSAQPQLPITKMNGIKILTPSIELQNKFANFVEKVNKQKIDFEESLKKLEEMQSALMQEYFG